MPSISIAEELAKKQREISISEFFERNKQILGYDSATKALLTAVKEGVDNSLDAGADADILPDILVEVKKIDKEEFVVVVEDNGPGIVKKEVANVFGRLLYGSRFFSRAQRRGQQGLGISGAVMYGQITTGKPTKIRSKVAEQDVAYEIELILDTKKNRPNVVEEDFVVWERAHGTRGGQEAEVPRPGRGEGAPRCHAVREVDVPSDGLPQSDRGTAHQAGPQERPRKSSTGVLRPASHAGSRGLLGKPIPGRGGNRLWRRSATRPTHRGPAVREPGASVVPGGRVRADSGRRERRLEAVRLGATRRTRPPLRPRNRPRPPLLDEGAVHVRVERGRRHGR